MGGISKNFKHVPSYIQGWVGGRTCCLIIFSSISFSIIRLCIIACFCLFLAIFLELLTFHFLGGLEVILDRGGD